MLDIGNLPVLEKSSSEKQSHPCANSTVLTVVGFYVATQVVSSHDCQPTEPYDKSFRNNLIDTFTRANGFVLRKEKSLWETVQKVERT